MFTAEERLAALETILGTDYRTTNQKTHYTWACIHCIDEGGDEKGDNFHFDTKQNKYSCFADEEHTRRISFSIREFYKGIKKKKSKEPLDLIPITEAPQEIVDYLISRKMTVTALHSLGVRFDRTHGLFYIPTGIYRNKVKCPFSGNVWWEQQFLGTKKFTKEEEERLQTEYPCEKYKGQKHIIVLEGIFDIWSAKSFFSEEFLNKYYVVGTVNGCSYFPPNWKIATFWDKFETITIVPDQDLNQAGQKAAKKLESFIKNKKANIITLPLKNKRIVFGEEVDYISKDFNDWVIEGNKEEDFLDLLRTDDEYTERVNDAVLEISKSDNKLQLLIDDVHKLGVIGEDSIIAVVFLCFLSHKFTDTCLGFVVKGRFSSGKSVLVSRVASLFPPDNVLSITSFSKLALQYMFDLSNKILIQTEEPPANDLGYWELFSQLRQLISEGEITRAIVEKNPVTNKMETNFYKVLGPVAYGSTTTQKAIHEENESRLLSLQTDDTPAHIAHVKDMLDKKAMGGWISKDEETFIKKKWRTYIDRLPKTQMREIVIPFSDQMDMCIYGPDMLRDYDKLQKLMKILAYFEQGVEVSGPVEKVSKADTSHEFAGITPNKGQLFGKSERHTPKISVLPKHYKSIYDLTKGFFNSKAMRISENVSRNYERIKREYGSLPFTTKQVAKSLNLSRNRAQELVGEWLSESMIDKLDEKGDHGAFKYRINTQWEVIDAELTPPDQIDLKYCKNGDSNEEEKEEVEDRYAKWKE